MYALQTNSKTKTFNNPKVEYLFFLYEKNQQQKSMTI